MPLINEYGNYKEKLDKLNSEFSDMLKSSILQEAIQGKLVPQNPNDEPASVLLERIRDEKERLVKEKKIKRNKNESYIFKENNHFYEKIGKEVVPIDNELPFEIPKPCILFLILLPAPAVFLYLALLYFPDRIGYQTIHNVKIFL